METHKNKTKLLKTIQNKIISQAVLNIFQNKTKA